MTGCSSRITGYYHRVLGRITAELVGIKRTLYFGCCEVFSVCIPSCNCTADDHGNKQMMANIPSCISLMFKLLNIS